MARENAVIIHEQTMSGHPVDKKWLAGAFFTQEYSGSSLVLSWGQLSTGLDPGFIAGRSKSRLQPCRDTSTRRAIL
jgi:hypothetical protein